MSLPICALAGSPLMFFSTLGEASIHLFALSTAANVPMVFMPVVGCSLAAAWFFVAFTGAALLCFGMLALAVAAADWVTTAEPVLTAEEDAVVVAVAVAVARAVMVMTAAVATTALAAALVGSGGGGGSVAEVSGGSGCE